MKLKIGDRVKIVSGRYLSEWTEGAEIKIGMMGIVKEAGGGIAGVEFDEYINGHNGYWEGRNGHCWYIPYEYLEKIEETDTEEESKEEVNETKTATFEQKILKVLREEIGVATGEEFDVYLKGKKQWTCKFEGNAFFRRLGGKFRSSEVWKDIICNFDSCTFKRKPFVPKYKEEYFFLVVGRDENKNIRYMSGRRACLDDTIDYGLLALGNVFRSEKKAFENKNKLAEKLEKLRKGE